MAGELTIFKNGSLPSTKFAGANLPTQRLDDGVSAGFPRVSYKGSKWGIRYQGAYTPIQVRMPDNTMMQSPYLDVVVLKASGHPNKAWYAGPYQEGETITPPDCWSSDGAKPDAGSPKPQSRTCVGCMHNVWGSKINRDTGQATRGKACMDSKRLAVVPVGDIENQMYGGPMMLSVPPSSLKRLGPYQNLLQANGFHYAAVWTRITFDPESAYPLFNFDAIAALNDIQADQVLVMVNHPQIDRILDADQSSVEAWDESAQSVHAAINPNAPATAADAMAAVQAKASPKGEVVQFPGGTQPGTASQPAAKTEAEIRAEVVAELTAKAMANAAAAKPAAPPQTSADAGPIPPHLARTPAEATTLPPEQAPEPQAEQPDPPLAATVPALPAGMVLPPGMTPEMAKAFMAGITAQSPPKQRRQRTKPVSPTAGDSSQPAPVTGLAGAATPEPAGPVASFPVPQTAAPAPVSGPAAAGSDAAVAAIMGSINALI